MMPVNGLPIKTMPLWLIKRDRGMGHISKVQRVIGAIRVC
jgi:hypothetical protein